MRILLTQAEVDLLQTGDPVVVIWSGGNGPIHYDVVRDQFEQVWAYYKGTRVDRLDMVGQHPLTQVWRT